MTACATLYTDPLGGPTLRCGRSLGHAGPHDPMAMPRALMYLVPPAEPFTWELTPGDAELVDRALETLRRQLWAARRDPDALRERERISSLRASLTDARARVPIA